jgi:hypothetical protein
MRPTWHDRLQRHAALTAKSQRQHLYLPLIFSLVLVTGPVRADDCAIILKAFETLAVAPSYSQTITMKDTPPMLSIAIGDVLYVNADDKWQKVQLKPGGRLGILKTFVPDAASLKDCSANGSDTLDGKAMTTYTYTPPIPEGMEGLAKGGPQILWVGDTDGLPYRMTTEDIEMTMSYDAVTPPIP